VREKLIEELVKEVFGPRNGSEERLQGDPVKEYLTGVIIPKGYMAEDTEPDSEITIPAGENLNEDDTSTGETAFSAAPSELDPKMRAKSFGLSFLLRGKIRLLPCALHGVDTNELAKSSGREHHVM